MSRAYLDVEDWQREWAEVIAARKVALMLLFVERRVRLSRIEGGVPKPQEAPMSARDDLIVFTEEDVTLVAETMHRAQCACGDAGDIIYPRIARAVLTALAAAGRLLPPSAEHREEWTYRAEINGRQQRGEDGAEVFDTREEVVDFITSWSRTYPRMSVADVRYASRTVVEGPWVEEDGSTDAPAP